MALAQSIETEIHTFKITVASSILFSNLHLGRCDEGNIYKWGRRLRSHLVERSTIILTTYQNFQSNENGETHCGNLSKLSSHLNRFRCVISYIHFDRFRYCWRLFCWRQRILCLNPIHKSSKALLAWVLWLHPGDFMNHITGHDILIHTTELASIHDIPAILVITIDYFTTNSTAYRFAPWKNNMNF